MKLNHKLYLTILFLTITTVQAQKLTWTNTCPTDSLISKKFLNKSIIPASLIGIGILLNKSDFEKSFQKDIRNIVGNNFNNPIDDYLRYVPIFEMYLADIAGLDAKNHWFDQTKNLVLSNMLSNFITYRLKISTGKRRPNGSDDLKSFPSGHTSTAFTNASVLYEEFKNTNPLIAYSGYAFAVSTGAFRIMNNAHWLSDIMVSAGIGIIVTKLVYYFEPFKNFNPFKKSKNITLVPQINEDSYGLYFAYRL